MATEKTTAEQIAQYIKNPGKGMIIDGVIASEAIDSSGEILKVDGCDISSLTTDGVLNTEHRGDDAAGFSFNDVIGRCTFAKKIYKLTDCANDRERHFWKQVQLPFIYGKFRLFDGAGHPGAISAAAAIRDMLHAGEDIICRFSVEGATLQRKGNVLERSIARKVAATFKPCNKSANSGVLADPNGPPMPGEVQKGEHEHPSYMRLGGTHEFVGNPIVEEESLDKAALSMGGANVAPSALEGGAALAREDIQGRSKKLAMLKSQVLAAIRDWDGEGDFKKFLKARLPEADESFIEHFADMADDYHLKKKQDEEPKYSKRQRKEFDRNKEVLQAGPVQDPAAPGRSQPPNGTVGEPARAASFPPALPAVTGGVAPRRSKRTLIHMDDQGVLHTGRQSDSVYGPGLSDEGTGFPMKDYQNDEVYNAILDPHNPAHRHVFYEGDGKTPIHPEVSPERIMDTVHKPWHRAMSDWKKINLMAREGKTPESLLWHSMMFSALSPNTPVPLHELYYGYFKDLVNHYGLDHKSPITRRMQLKLRQGIGSGMQLPEFEREHYAAHLDDMKSAAAESEEDRGDLTHREGQFDPTTGEKKPTHFDEPFPSAINQPPPLGSNGREPGETPQERGMMNYFKFHPHVMQMMQHYKDDGRSAAAMLMHMKDLHFSNKKKGDKLDFPDVAGFGPKLARFGLAMAGAGNIHVNDRHMIRSLYGLDLKKHSDTIAHITKVLNDEANHHVLEAMDHHFFTKHKAVQHVLNTFPAHFKGHEQQSIFPAMWLHWLTIQHYERLKHMAHKGFNGGTDHYPFFQSIRHILDKHQIAHDGDSSFDFGANAFKKSESCMHDPMPVRTARALHEIHAKHGEVGASLAHFLYLVPALLSSEKAEHHWQVDPAEEAQGQVAPEPQPSEIVRKFERWSIELRRAVRLLNKAESPLTDATQPAPFTAKFEGREVQPGLMEAKTQRLNGQRYHILHQNKGYTFAVPEKYGANFAAHHIVKFPRKFEGTHYTIHRPVKTLSNPHAIDSTVHAVPKFTVMPEQHKLVHGIDVAEQDEPVPNHFSPGVSADHSKWVQRADGTLAYMKGDTSGVDEPRREVLYHNLANQFFGMGHFLPTTALVTHPETGKQHSIQAMVPDAEHVEAYPEPWKHQGWSPSQMKDGEDDNARWVTQHPHHVEALKKLDASGELDKLAMMNMIMGNTDRHPNNFMYTPRDEKAPIKLIDNGLAFDTPSNWRVPMYWMQHAAMNPATPGKSWRQTPIHPEAVKWLKSLDPQKLQDAINDGGGDHSWAVRAQQRLAALREYFDRVPNPIKQGVITHGIT